MDEDRPSPETEDSGIQGDMEGAVNMEVTPNPIHIGIIPPSPQLENRLWENLSLDDLTGDEDTEEEKKVKAKQFADKLAKALDNVSLDEQGSSATVTREQPEAYGYGPEDWASCGTSGTELGESSKPRAPSSSQSSEQKHEDDRWLWDICQNYESYLEPGKITLSSCASTQTSVEARAKDFQDQKYSSGFEVDDYAVSMTSQDFQAQSQVGQPEKQPGCSKFLFHDNPSANPTNQ